MLKRTAVLGALLCLAIVTSPALADQAPAKEAELASAEISQDCFVVETASVSTETDLNDLETSLLRPESSLIPEEDVLSSQAAASEQSARSSAGDASWYGAVYSISTWGKICDNCCPMPDGDGCCSCCKNRSCTVTQKVCCPRR